MFRKKAFRHNKKKTSSKKTFSTLTSYHWQGLFDVRRSRGERKQKAKWSCQFFLMTTFPWHTHNSPSFSLSHTYTNNDIYLFLSQTDPNTHTHTHSQQSFSLPNTQTQTHTNMHSHTQTHNNLSLSFSHTHTHTHTLTPSGHTFSHQARKWDQSFGCSLFVWKWKDYRYEAAFFKIKYLICFFLLM